MNRNMTPLKKLNMNRGWIPPSHSFRQPSSLLTVRRQSMNPLYFMVFDGCYGCCVASFESTTSKGFVSRVAIRLETTIMFSRVVILAEMS